MPPNISDIGKAGPSLGYLMVALPMAIARTLHRIMTNATLGLQETLEGKAANKVACNVKPVNLYSPQIDKFLQWVTSICIQMLALTLIKIFPSVL